MTSPIPLGLTLVLLAAMLWLALTYLRVGTSTGTSKRALGFNALVYAEILLGAPAGERINLLHGLGAGAVAIGATWVWFKAKRGHGWAGTSANLIVVLTAVSLVLGVATKLSFKPSFNTGHYTAAVLLFLAAVWHAYEMRIYRPE